MPLEQGKSKSVIGNNIKEMIGAGEPQKQAVAASLNNADKFGAKKKSKPLVPKMKKNSPAPMLGVYKKKM